MKRPCVPSRPRLRWNGESRAAREGGEDPHLRRAIELAESVDATLHVVHAFSLPDPLLYPYPEMAFFDPESVDRLRETSLKRLETQVRAISTSDRIRLHAMPVPADLAMLDVADEVGADMVVAGATRHGQVTRRILGTTAQRVVRAASVPVLVSRGAAHGSARRILLTTDLTPVSEKVQEIGIELAAALGRPEDFELRCLLVIDYDFALLPPMAPEELRGVGEVRLNGFMERTGLDRRGVVRAVRVGKPSREIVADAEEFGADLLVMGTHGRTGASRFLIGSVAESVLRSAPCDVLVVPTHAIETVARPSA